ncbi:calcium-binding protein [Phyllobacterium sp. P5_D12]
MPSTLPQSIFDLLFVTNGGWLRPTTNMPGTTGNDDLTYNNLLSGLLVDGGEKDDRIHITGGLTLLSTVRGGGGSDQIFGGTGADIIDGGDGNDFIEGGAGADSLSGGYGIRGGTDTLSYEHSNAAVTVNMAQLNALGNITVSGGHANGDLVQNNFENVVGSAYDDTITGNRVGGSVLVGLGGNDTLNGGDGYDTFVGGAGGDTMTGGLGADTAD